MEDLGLKITGYLSGMDQKVGEYDGKRKVTYRYLVVCGMESYLINSNENYEGSCVLQDIVTFKVTARVFGGKIFYSNGVLLI